MHAGERLPIDDNGVIDALLLHHLNYCYTIEPQGGVMISETNISEYPYTSYLQAMIRRLP